MSEQSGTIASPFNLREAFRLPDRAGSLFLAMAIYIGAVLLANEWATRVVQVTRGGFKLKSVFDFPADLAVTPQNGLIVVGTVIFGITFTQRDRVHRAGRAWVYLMLIVTTILASLQSWFLDVSWRIIVASTLAILLSEMADTEVFHKLRARKWFVRVIASNSVSIPIDTVIFNLVAFGGVLGAGLLIAIMIGDLIVKTVVATIAAFFRTRQ
jgi:queuosine precursor transporter